MTRRRAVLAATALAAGLLIAAAAALAGLPLLLGGTSITTALGPPAYVDETASSGVAHTYRGGPTFDTGGGVSVLDCSGDGRPDLYVAGGSAASALYRNDSPTGGALRFTDVTDGTTGMTGATGAYPIDLDADGQPDLAVLRVGGVDLLRGLGDCRFERANDALGFRSPTTWVTAFSATWEGAERLPTLAVGSYVMLDADGRLAFDCADNALYRPAAGGTNYGPAIPLTPGFCTLSILFSDWDGSGRRDLRITNDRHYYTSGQDQLWRIEPGQPPRAYTADDGWVSMQIWGMGIASQDLTGDGLPEVYLTSQGDNRLQTLLAGPAKPTFRDIAGRLGVKATQPFTGGDILPSTAWHPEFGDVNDDGFPDLFVSKGNVNSQPDFASRDPSDLFLGQPDGTFAQAADRAGVLSFDRGRGASLADLNLDGLPDLVLVNVETPVRVWRNVGTGTAAAPVAMGRWIAVTLKQAGANRDAIGSVVEVRVGSTVLRREVVIGGGHGGGALGWLTFGVGSATRADIRVTWPDGELGPWLPLDTGTFATIERGAGEPKRWVPPAP